MKKAAKPDYWYHFSIAGKDWDKYIISILLKKYQM